MDLFSDLKSKPFNLMLSQYVYVAVASITVYLLRPPYLASVILAIAPPALFSVALLKRTRKKVLMFSFASLFLFAIPVELACRLADAWDVASVLPRPFGLIPLENMLYAFLQFIWVLAVYELFVAGESEEKISPRFRYYVGIFAVFASSVFSLFAIDRRFITVDYIYIGLASTIVPLLAAARLFQAKIKRIAGLTVFFAAVFFTHEMFSIRIGHWWWPGDYVLPVSIFGARFALEDVLIWHLLSSPALAAGYELFANQRHTRIGRQAAGNRT